ncbi:hypothetical protein AMS68_003652 [Peltaster fructicola]|uniref:MARVEL domain-containing protein n=1 Tax=Peltaster fructicola TaxID=286661 RepID=A0A6H0XU17_9PEZI|nr:hypothetical protein AMS68_003652 [Peltaster fructicola]
MQFLSHRTKLPIHIVQLFLIVCVIGLSIPRLFMKGQPRTRANTIALGMGAKSIIIISYQLLTEHVRRLQRWASLKAFVILNGLEIVFWAAVVFLVIQGNIQACIEVGCILSWIVVGLSILNTVLVIWVFAIVYMEFRESRRLPVGEKRSKAFPSMQGSQDAV